MIQVKPVSPMARPVIFIKDEKLVFSKIATGDNNSGELIHRKGFKSLLVRCNSVSVRPCAFYLLELSVMIIIWEKITADFVKGKINDACFCRLVPT